MKKPVAAPSLPAISDDLKKRVLGHSSSAVLSEPADIDMMMKAASTTLVDPGVPIGDYVDGQRRKASSSVAGNPVTDNPVAVKDEAGAKPKLHHVYIDAEVGFLLKETAARRRMSPRVLLEAIIKAACAPDDRPKNGSAS